MVCVLRLKPSKGQQRNMLELGEVGVLLEVKQVYLEKDHLQYAIYMVSLQQGLMDSLFNQGTLSK